MQLVLDTNGLTLKKRNNSFWIVSKKHRRVISPHRVSSIAVVRDCLISTAAIHLAIKHRIPIFLFSYAGKAVGSLWSPYFGSIATIRRNQLKLAETEAATSLIVDWFQLKMERQQTQLLVIAETMPNKAVKTGVAIKKMTQQSDKMNIFRGQHLTKCRMQLLGTEGVAAKIYWQTMSKMLPTNWQFPKRSRRPALDNFNAVLNYLFGMLYNLIENATLAAGLDPMLGFLHVDDYLKTTFVFDAIEPFRPWVEALLVETIIAQPKQQAYFEQVDGGIRLNKAGRKFYIPRFNAYFEQVIEVNQQRLSRKNHIYYFLGHFAQTLK